MNSKFNDRLAYEKLRTSSSSTLNVELLENMLSYAPIRVWILSIGEILSIG